MSKEMMTSYEAEYAFLGMVGDVLNNKSVRSLPEGVTVDDIITVGKAQNMLPLTFCALNSMNHLDRDEDWKEYQKQFLTECARSEVQIGECDKLIRYLCECDLKILPLKGCVLKDLYPSPHLRTMSDVDILYDGVTSKELSVLMEKFGYSTERLDWGFHDIFYKVPCMNAEMHRGLIAKDSPYKLVLSDMLAKAVPDEKIPNLYHMKPDDLYIHLIVHAAVHFEEEGIGVRPVGDIYVVNQVYKDMLNREYIRERLSSVGLEQFEEKMRTVANSFFGGNMNELESVSELDMNFFFRGSSLGKGGYTWKYMKKGHSSKIGCILARVFYPYGRMREQYPILEKAPVLLPVTWVLRIFRILSSQEGRGSVKGFVNNVQTMDNAQSDFASSVMKTFGLKAGGGNG